MKYVSGILAIMIFATSVFAAEEAPQTFTLDGRLYSDATGTNPLLDPNVTLVFQILNDDETCILYEETRTGFNSALSNGYFNLQVGSEVGATKRSAGDSGNSMASVYSNTMTIVPGKRVSDGTACSAPPQAGDQRFVRIQVTPSSGGTRVLTPNMALDSVPHAIIAERAESLRGLGPAQLLQVNTTSGQALSQSNVENIFTTSNYNLLVALLNGSSNLYTKPAANGTIAIPNLTSTPPSTPSAGQIWYDGGAIKYYDAVGGVTRTISTGTSTQVAAAGGSAATPSISFAGDPDTGWYAPLANTLAAATGGTERVRIDASGNVGIATADPTFGTPYGANETVVGVTGKGDSTNSIGRFVLANTRATATNLDYTGFLDFVSVANPGSEHRSAGIGSMLSGAGGSNGYGGDLRFYTKLDDGAYTQKMMIGPNGNVGIGTTAPNQILDIQATDSNPNVKVQNNSTTTAKYPGIAISNYAGSSGGTPVIALFNSDGSFTSATPLSSGKRLGVLTFRGGTATGAGGSYNQGAAIASTATETFSGTAAGSNLTFATTANGTTTANERLRIDQNGNIGIGTTAPLAPLDVSNGAVTMVLGADTNANTRTNNTSKYARIGLAPYANADIPTSVISGANGAAGSDVLIGGGSLLMNASTAVKFYTAASTTIPTGTERMRITPAGDIGIGTTAPGRLLHVNGPMRVQPAALPGTPATGDIAVDSGDANKLKYYNGSAWLELGAGSGGSFSNVSNISNSAGDITLAPQATTGKVAITSGTPSSSSTTGALVVTGGLGVSGNINSAGTVAGNIVQANTSLLTPQIYGSSVASGTIRIDGTSNATKGHILLNSAGGNVGIGTSSPASKLTVTYDPTVSGTAGTAITADAFANTSSYYAMRARASTGAGATTDLMVVRGDGSVGIGTTAPNAMMEVAGSTAATSFLVRDGNGNSQVASGARVRHNAGIAMIESADNAEIHIDDDNNSTTDRFAISKDDGSIELMRVQEDGNVGIGTTAPTAPLHIKQTSGAVGINIEDYSTSGIGSIYYTPSADLRLARANSSIEINSAQGIKFITGGASERLRIDNVGNVGIGTTAPGRLLHINGPMRVQPAALPGAPATGDIAVDSGDANKLKYYNGSAWQELGAGSGGSFSNVSNISNSSGDVTIAAQTTTGKVAITSGTPSTSTTTGALVVTGGAGVSGSLNVGGAVNTTAINVGTSALIPQLYGSNANSGDIKIDGTSATTKGNVLLATAGGNVGVGTTAPNNKFRVDATNPGSYNTAAISTQNGITVRNGDSGAAANGEHSTLYMIAGDNGPAKGAINLIQSNHSSSDAVMTFQVSANAGSVEKEAMRIVGSSGNVGIGTTNPTSPFSVRSNSTATSGTPVGVDATMYVYPSSTSTGTFTATQNTLLLDGPNNISTGSVRSSFNNVYNTNTGTANVTTGSHNSVINAGAGTISLAVGNHNAIENTATGTITKAYGTYVTMTNTGTGSIGSSYGVYIDTLTGATKFGLYQVDTTAKNYFGGNVGIGTTAPARLLHVAGPIRIDATALPSTPVIGDIAIDSGDANKFKYYNGSTWISLMAGGSGSFTSVTSISNSAGNITLSPVSTSGAVVIDSGTSAFSTGSGALRVVGGVGISENLHVGGNTELAGAIDIGNTATIHSQSGVAYTGASSTANSPAGTGVSTGNDINADGSYSGYTASARNTAGTYQSGYFGVSSSPSGYSPTMVFGKQTGANAYEETMRISDAGYVGMGTTAPVAKLDVTTSGGNDPFRAAGAGGVVKFDQYGTFTTPNGIRDIASVGNFQPMSSAGNGYNRLLVGSNVNYNAGTNIYDVTANAAFDRAAIEFKNGGDIAFISDSTDRSATTTVTPATWNGLTKMVIRPSGNVGIGTTAPDSRFTVAKSENSTAAGYYSGMKSTYTISPATNEANSTYKYGVFGSVTIPAGTAGTVDQPAAVGGEITNSSTSNSNVLTGISGFSYNKVNANITSLIGGWNGAESDAGTVTNLTGTYASIEQYGASTNVTNAYGTFVHMRKSGAGTLTNRYGVFLETPVGAATNDFGFYQASTQKNVFMGNVGIGTTNPGRLLHVNGPMRITAAALPGTPAIGDIAVDSGDSNKLKYYNGSAWLDLGAASGGTISNTSSISNSSGDITLAPQTSTGKVAITSGTPSSSTTTGAMVVTGGAGVSGNLFVGGTINSNTSVNAFSFNAISTGTFNPLSSYRSSSGTDEKYWDLFHQPNSFAIRAVNDAYTASNNAIVFNRTGTAITSTYIPTGNVGIGTTAPAYMLDVNGSTYSRGPTSTAGFISGSGGVDYAVPNGDAIQFGSVNADGSTNSNWMRIMSTGNVGIGSTNPSSKLHVQGPNAGGYPFTIQASPGLGPAAYMNIALNNTTSGAYKSAIDFQNSGTTKFSLGVDYQGNGTNNFSLFDNAAGVHRFYVDATGNVGIGTTAPGYKLDVSESGNPTTRISRTDASDSNNQALILYRNRSDTTAPGAGFGTGLAFALEGFTDGSATTAGLISTAWETAQTNDTTARDSSMRFSTDLDGTLDERMRITSAGNVGIGTTAPTEKLEVNGSVRATSFISSSDIRLKRDIASSSGLDIVKQLTGVDWIWKSTGIHDSGVIAQDVEKVLPNAVVTDPNTGLKAVKYNALFAPIIQSIKELYYRLVGVEAKVDRAVASLKAENEKLKADNQAKEKEMAELKARMDRIEKMLAPKTKTRKK